MNYTILFNILKTKSNYSRFSPYVKENIVPQEVSVVVKDMGKFFESTSVDEINWDEFVPWFKLNRISTLSKDKHSIYDKILGDLDKEYDEDSESRILKSLVEKDYAMKIADHLLLLSEGDDSKSILDAEELIKDYKSETDVVSKTMDDLMITDDPEEVLRDDSSDGLEWRLEELNISAGPIGKGDFVVVAAPVNTGKTTFLCSEVSHMASQLPEEKDVLWFNNEERSIKVKRRIWQSALGWDKATLMHSPIHTVAELEKLWGRTNRVKIFEDASAVHDVETIISNSNPGLIVFDQLYNIEGFSNSFSEVEKHKRLFHWARQLAINYCPVITVHQADGTAAGEFYPEMHQLYNSRVGIQGSADLIIMIGRSLDFSMKRPNDRGIHVAKNKLDGGPRSIEEERHGRYDVEIDPTHARFKGIY